jgi:vitamin K-dependent gamma-carboxylase
MAEDTLQRSGARRVRIALECALERGRHRISEDRVDVASLCALRVMIGFVMCGAAIRFMAKGWVREFFVQPQFHFAYPGLGFVKPLPESLMWGVFGAMALLGLGLAAGLWYRACSIGLFLAFTYVELIDRALYLNHYYLVSLLLALLALAPAGRAYSLDALRNPKIRVDTVPAWMLWALRLQVGVVYFFAGVAKLNADWLFEAQPLRIWLAAQADFSWLGPVLVSAPAAYAMSWLGAFFDLSVVGFLLARRTRAAAFVVLLGFHALTGLLFPIGIFPWLMSAAATVFLAPDWPRRWLDRARTFARRFQGSHDCFGPCAWVAPRWLLPVLALHAVVQVVVPLRSVAAATPGAWTRQGFDFAWNVMVAEMAGDASFRVVDRNSGATIRVEPSQWLARFQCVAMAQDPDLVRQAARLLAERYRSQGHEVAVFADAVASLNGRPSSLLVDPEVDLAKPLTPGWILPLVH